MSASRTIDFSGGKSHSSAMTENDKYPSDAAERFQVRLPPGLRDRIKAYAERHGRSMNTEIVRILEREFPEQIELDKRLEHLAEMMNILTAGRRDQRFDKFLSEFEETIRGIVSGRVTGVDLETREAIASMWESYRERLDLEEIEDAQAQYDFDDEEWVAFEATGTPEKYGVPPPRRKKFNELNDEERADFFKRHEEAEDGPPKLPPKDDIPF